MTNPGQIFSMRRFYCHRCDCQVQIEENSMQCRTCQSGFVEELEIQDNPPEPTRRIRIGNESSLGRRHNVSFGEGLGFGRQVSSLLEQFIVGWHLFLIKYHSIFFRSNRTYRWHTIRGTNQSERLCMGHKRSGRCDLTGTVFIRLSY